MINAKTQKEIDRLSDDLISNFAPPEFVPGCKVTAITDKDEYATDNGWIVAICGRHNNQRCRWTGQLSSIAINDYVDVLYYPSYKLFVVFGQGGTSAAQSGKYLLTDGTRDSTGEQDFTAGIKADAIAESTAGAGVTVDGVLLKDNDLFPNSDKRGLALRFINQNGLTTWTSHFRTGDAAGSGELTGYSWDTSPTVINYSFNSDYLRVAETTTNRRDFMSKNIPAATAITGKYLLMRAALGANGEVGLRIDDSANTATNFVEIYLSGALANGMMRLDFRYGATTVTSNVIVPCGQFLTFLLSTVSTTQAAGYLYSEMATPTNITGFATGATAWIPNANAAGTLRAGLFTKETGTTGNPCYVDYFYNNLS